MRMRNLLAVLLAAALVGLTGCVLLPAGETPEPTPEPTDNQVVLTAPFRAVLDEGESVTGAALQYVGQDDDGIYVRIDNQDSHKKIGDSFNWSGSPVPGVELDYKLRVMGVYLDVFQAWGDVDIVILDPEPEVTELPEDGFLVFKTAVATYAVDRGEMIPGTTYSYLGKTDQGAEFGGLEDYPYREIADSLDWSGRLRDNVYIDLTMRVSTIQDEQVTLVGTATVWILP